ncbi:TIGR04283 family arsenosugar biosynthesis glycosyltransferase [Magnetospirillum sp. SS-4]|uniref:TIGR04283 family arsenosugar biosynthesis glycosyltransferase n=1 Tax=Magnetospirillum sp. SS-4 TaxID=2681465 RepID=UPI00137D1D8A|nr:TIGR04283 family arsenosugar biosynthesis glycosyltransferase [Magnetospirillum sp. SS-4]CAA7627601.1 Glycosyl transferase family 2 [Magnetospirillum sp. SS-4]
MSLSVVIPTLNAARHLPGAVASLGGADEVIVADGGSGDGTPDLARDLGLPVVVAERGRGTQLAAGAAAASHPWLLFLHADTRLAADWRSEAEAFMADRHNERRAAVFRFALDSTAWQARALEALVEWRTRWLGLPYGDQGLLISRSHYREIGGYRPLPLMEDVDLVRRIGRGGLSVLKTQAVTSAERWRRDGWLRRSARNLLCLGLYFAGLSPRTIQRLYG